ncbi:MAG: hypothetical protein P4L31_00350 [Candidatus Babeliales bacterium]|nr:hypothetical protein [Candidatus Babeliales bacterium]
MKQVIKILLLSVLMTNGSTLLASTFGSTANNQTRFATGIQNFASGATNYLGYASTDAGFTLPNATSTVTYNAVGDLNGPMSLNGGTLILANDFIMQNQATFATNGIFTGNGRITGNNFSVMLPNRAFTLANAFAITSATVVANSYFTVNTTLRFLSTGNVLNGNGNFIDLTNGTLSVGAGGSLLIKNAMIRGIDAGTIFCEDSLATLSLQNVTWIQDAIYTFSQGILDVLNDVEMTGSSIFAYSSSGLLNIRSNSTLSFDIGMTFSYAAANNSRLTFADATSAISFDQATLFTNNNGLSLKKGIAMFNGFCPIFNLGATSAAGILVGDNASAANNFVIQVGAEAGLNVQSGFFVYQNI